MPIFAAYLLGAGLVAAPDKAWAACSTNTPSNGDTVTCSGGDTTGVGDGTADDVKVTVKSNASITVGDNDAAIWLRDGASVTNNGTIIAGNGGAGIVVDNGATINNNGSITVGIGGVGIDVLNGNFVSNAGSITAGNFGIGINLCCENTVVNSGRITIGNDGFGIFAAFGSGNKITNSGIITVGRDSFGIAAFDGFINSKTNATITNSGKIVAGAGSTGIAVVSNYNIVNTGLIAVGAGGAGITANLDDNVITNKGTIATGPGGTGIEALGDNNLVNNRGTVVAGKGGIGVLLGGTDNTLNNYGLIKATGGGLSIEACSCSASNTVNNFGKIDGAIKLVDTVNNSQTFNNSGLLTITDSLSSTAFAVHRIDGQFNQAAGGVIELRVNNTTNGNDALSTNSAKIRGTLRLALQAGLYNAVTTYANVFTSKKSVTTAFDAYAVSSPFFTVTPVYDTGDPNSYKSISLVLSLVGFDAVAGMTGNQRAVGRALQSVYSTGLTGNAKTFYLNLFAAKSISVYDQLSGQGTSAAQGAAFMSGGTFLSLFGQGPFGLDGGGAPGPLGYAGAPKHPADDIIKVRAQDEPVRHWQSWAKGFGGRRTVDGDATTGTFASSQNMSGGAGGVIYRVDPDSAVGVAIGITDSRFSVDSLATSGDLTGAHVGLHGAKRWGAFYAAGALAYSHYDNDTTRRITGVGPAETATGSFGSDQFSGRLELGWRNEFGGNAVTPFAAVQYSRIWQQGYGETSVTDTGAPGILGLTYASQGIDSLPTTLGVQVDSRLDLGGGLELLPYTRLAWVHEFEPATHITATFTTLPAASFTVDGARAASDAARIESGLRLALSERLSLTAGFTGEFSKTSQSYVGTGGVQLTW